MKVGDFNYDLPPELIAQTPASPRDSSRLLHLDRSAGSISHLRFHDIVTLLQPGDLLVMNNTRVIPARLLARKTATGGKVEILLLRQLSETRWKALIRGRNIRGGARLALDKADIACQCLEKMPRGLSVIEFDRDIAERLNCLGEMPLPPYIQTRLAEAEKYQTVYSEAPGSAAAPTAGLHFTPELLTKLRVHGVQLAFCTLHIGLDTFQPVRVDAVADHVMHSEFASLDAETARLINGVIASGRRVIAVGTTSARTLETAARAHDVPCKSKSASATSGRARVSAFCGDTDLFIYPGYRWRVVHAIITNFHLPRSTLLMMLSAFAGREAILDAYEIAKVKAYRFYSFGDAMFVT